MADYDLFQIEISRNYTKNEWREDLKKVRDTQYKIERLTDELTLSFLSSKCTFSQHFKEKCISEVVRIGGILIFHLTKL